jgi:hypothetical protein
MKEGIHMVIHAVEFIMGEMEVAYKCSYYKARHSTSLAYVKELLQMLVCLW